jgi:hypothetical protein
VNPCATTIPIVPEASQYCSHHPKGSSALFLQIPVGFGFFGAYFVIFFNCIWFILIFCYFGNMVVCVK